MSFNISFKMKTLNFGAPCDSECVNVFEFDNPAIAKVAGSDIPLPEGADVLDRRFKTASRGSPLMQTNGMEWIWTDEFSVETYIEKANARILAAFASDPALRQSQMAFAKIDAEAEDANAQLEKAVMDLVVFDANCAKAIRENMAWDEFVSLHAAASSVVETTVQSILQELTMTPHQIFFLQEVNQSIVDTIRDALLESNQFMIRSTDDGSTAIIYPSSFVDVEVLPIFGAATSLEIETLVLKYQNYVFISTHFSSKAKKDAHAKTPLKNYDDQLVVFIEFIATLQKQGLTTVVGGDFNHPIEVPSDFLVYPARDIPTTSKKRTKLQTQIRKIGKHDLGSKDRIVIVGKDINVSDYRVRSLYKDGKAFCSAAFDTTAAASDASLAYPVRMQYPLYGTHYPDHDLVEATVDNLF
jgi:hypothetical protein